MKEMTLPQICALPKQVSDKIAAGEVVDRPLSIVKELLENAIDAGAEAITVEIRNGGKSYIRVTDDGCGIAKDQVLLAFQRHATSKIRSAEDLETVNTLGFRGEALASIAAVSQVELITKPSAAKAGIKLRLQGGQVVSQADTGCPDGTTMIVTSLFYNTPARLKFLKGDHTESSLIIDFVSKMALAYPKIRLRMINNGNILFNTPGNGQLYHNILTIYSKEMGQKLLPVRADNGSMLVEGYLSDPSYSKTNRKSQIFFVNGRCVQSRIMEKAVSMAYSDKLFDGRYPVAYLFLYVNPQTLDVNIHPNKKEVRFDDELSVLDFIHTALRDRLNTKQAIPEIKAEALFSKKSIAEEAPEAQVQVAMAENGQEAKTPAPAVLPEPEVKSDIEGDAVDIKKLLKTMRQQQNESKKERAAGKEVSEATKATGEVEKHGAGGPQTVEEAPADYAAVSSPSEPPVPARRPARFDFTQLQISGALFRTYITASDGEFFYLIDQHAAHERVFYEQLLAQYRAEEKPAQLLMLPIVKEVTPAVAELASQWLSCLRGFGFSAEEFGSRSYVIREIPLMMSQQEAGDFLDYFFDNIEEGFQAKDQARIDKIIVRSCKQAVKANDALSPEEIKSLLSQLSETENPFSCPHGRPTFIKFSKYEIEKMFKRV